MSAGTLSHNFKGFLSVIQKCQKCFGAKKKKMAIKKIIILGIRKIQLKCSGQIIRNGGFENVVLIESFEKW